MLQSVRPPVRPSARPRPSSPVNPTELVSWPNTRPLLAPARPRVRQHDCPRQGRPEGILGASQRHTSGIPEAYQWHTSGKPSGKPKSMGKMYENAHTHNSIREIYRIPFYWISCGRVFIHFPIGFGFATGFATGMPLVCHWYASGMPLRSPGPGKRRAPSPQTARTHPDLAANYKHTACRTARRPRPAGRPSVPTRGCPFRSVRGEAACGCDARVPPTKRGEVASTARRYPPNIRRDRYLS